MVKEPRLKEIAVHILGIDPGTLKMGVGVISADRGDIDFVYSGVLTPKRGNPISERLHYIYERLLITIEDWSPQEVAIEKPFASRNIRTAMAIGQAEAVAMVAAAHHGLPVSSYAPRKVKQAITDYGGSSKEQVQDMVKTLLGIQEISGSFDASDALAVAICHSNAHLAEHLQIND